MSLPLNSKLLIVDDERSMRELLLMLFKREGYRVSVADCGARAVEMIRSDLFDIIISDVRMPDMNGIEFLSRCRQMSPETMVILMTAFATIDTAREAFKLGADDFVQKPFDVDELKIIVRNALEKKRLRQENELLKRELQQRGSLGNLIGKSARMQAVYEMIKTVAMTTSTVLITGESGTGKELVARAIHEQSPRRSEPFVSVNCGALTETLLESELFGYIKGAFTGAVSNKKGLFEAASGGTIFLDEIGEMSLSMQVKLLRVLQERRVRHIGSADEMPVDVRVITATNRNLSEMIDSGDFREDLYYRISVIPIELPPLRERREDIRDLALHFLKRFSESMGKPGLSISEDTLRYLENYSWPGNVRQLENTIERAVAFETGSVITPERLPERILKYDPVKLNNNFELPEEGIDLEAFLNELEKSYIIAALRRTGGNQTRAAEMLGMPVRSLRHCLDKHGIRQTASLMRSTIGLGERV